MDRLLKQIGRHCSDPGQNNLAVDKVNAMLLQATRRQREAHSCKKKHVELDITDTFITLGTINVITQLFLLDVDVVGEVVVAKTGTLGTRSARVASLAAGMRLTANQVWARECLVQVVIQDDVPRNMAVIGDESAARWTTLTQLRPTKVRTQTKEEGTELSVCQLNLKVLT